MTIILGQPVPIPQAVYRDQQPAMPSDLSDIAGRRYWQTWLLPKPDRDGPVADACGRMHAFNPTRSRQGPV